MDPLLPPTRAQDQQQGGAGAWPGETLKIPLKPDCEPCWPVFGAGPGRAAAGVGLWLPTLGGPGLDSAQSRTIAGLAISIIRHHHCLIRAACYARKHVPAAAHACCRTGQLDTTPVGQEGSQGLALLRGLSAAASALPDPKAPR
ncbi:unnamed protein product [Rangifer tarandus platyrhynchus]|uniref:Uncharacterized protein n=2 Tax=Rangifer tarandus platyrhynchus TaxID=3082113 RepID=A0ABN8Z835_RANTA|nr:unnamed protein product [Rangifer tarandus platyrhynchus]